MLALLLLVVAVVVTIISLQDDRAPEGAPGAHDTPTAIPSSPDSVFPEISGPTDTPSDGPAGEGSSGEGSSGEARCVLDSGGMSCPRNFTIAGSAVGLYPGRTVPLPLRIENPNEEDVRVTSITVSVTGTSAASCETSYLQATDYTGPGFVVAGNDSSSISLPVTMPRAAPDACQGVTFTLSFAGKAEPA